MMIKQRGTTAPWKPGETVACSGSLVTFQHLAGPSGAIITRDDGVIEMVPLHTLAERRSVVTVGTQFVPVLAS